MMPYRRKWIVFLSGCKWYKIHINLDIFIQLSHPTVIPLLLPLMETGKGYFLFSES